MDVSLLRDTLLSPPVLSLFLLDMGIIAAPRVKDLSASGAFLPLFAIVAPLVNAALGIGLAYTLGVAEGDATLGAE